MDNKHLKIYPAKEVGSEFSLRVRMKIDSLLKLANNEEQKKDLYNWFKLNFWQTGVDFSISKDLVKAEGHRFAELKQYQAREALFRTQEIWFEECAIIEELTPLIIENGLVVDRESWGFYEERYRLSTAGWKMKL